MSHPESLARGLEALGWSDERERQLQMWLAGSVNESQKDESQTETKRKASSPGLAVSPVAQVARVVREDRGLYLVHDGLDCCSARPTGRLRQSVEAGEERPAVGDWAIIARPEGSDVALIKDLLPRYGTIARKVAGRTTRDQVVATNIDTALVVVGLDGGYNLARIERYLTLVWSSGAAPVVILNKGDLCDDPGSRLLQVRRRLPGVDVLVISAARGWGLEQLERHVLPGRTLVMLGSSGAGKSTLANGLLGGEVLMTAEVRASDDRGRHTTTARQLVSLPGGGLLIDTPGLREIQLWAQKSDLDGSFSDIEMLSQECRFRDCGHEGEPGCAVEVAVTEGRIDRARVVSYLKQQRELRRLELRASETGRQELRLDERQLGKLYRRVARAHPKHGGGR